LFQDVCYVNADDVRTVPGFENGHDQARPTEPKLSAKPNKNAAHSG
jgi:hypothetical protein